jgi:hypothetical protein
VVAVQPRGALSRLHAQEHRQHSIAQHPALGAHYRTHAERLDAALSLRGPDQLRVIADFLTEINDPSAGPMVAPPPSSGDSGTGSGTTTSSGS